MCGIALIYSPRFDSKKIEPTGDNPNSIDRITNIDLSALRRRGPDASSYRLIPFNPDSAPWIAYGSVLSVRGTGVTIQPLCTGPDLPRFVLLWNGEVFSCASDSKRAEFQNPDLNDGSVLLTWLSKTKGPEDVLRVMASLQGPFSFVLVRQDTGQVYFGRDPWGRRSLVGRLRNDGKECADRRLLQVDCIASVVLPDLSSNKSVSEEEWCEIPASGLFVGRIVPNHDGSEMIGDVCLYPWSQDHLHAWDSFKLSVNTISQIDVTPRVPALGTELNPSEVQQEFLNRLASAVSTRVRLASPYCRDCGSIQLGSEASATDRVCTHTRFGVLFSGGLDSTVLAALCDRFVPKDQPIDLINVAFEQLASGQAVSNRKTKPKSSGTVISANEAPDRQTALQSFAELSRLSADRQWQLVLVDVSLEEMRYIRENYIRQLLLPGKLTILDESLGLATWFAARARGTLHLAASTVSASADYTSPAKVLFVGSGIDEQLAGYSRHRVVFEKHGLAALENELALEMRRISERNLGRDDRIISDHGKEARFPYLDEDVIAFLKALPIRFKADLTLPRGIGEKYLLRQVAHDLGLVEAARLPKRAMQFGSRIAKAEGSSRLVGSADQLTIRSSDGRTRHSVD